MRLEQILRELVESVPGARGAVLADWEGEAVVAYTTSGESDYGIKLVGAHHGIILSRTREMIERMSLGHARRLTFVQDQFHVITAPVNQEYYLVLTLRPEAIPALAGFPIKRAVREIEADIG